MKIEIDQSIKLENTSKTTFIAFSNSINHVISISACEKKKIQTYFRRVGKPKVYVVITFTALIFLLIRSYLQNGMMIIIDKEYPGYEKSIIQKLKEFISDNTKKENCRVHFVLIGKKSNAHIVAYSAFRGKTKTKIKPILAEDVIKIINLNKKKSGIA